MYRYIYISFITKTISLYFVFMFLVIKNSNIVEAISSEESVTKVHKEKETEGRIEGNIYNVYC